jgi:hypothetical protein
MYAKMTVSGFLKNVKNWLWPSILIMLSSFIRKGILESLTFKQIPEGLLLYIAYLICIIPVGFYLSKSRWFNSESKLALVILFITYFFFEYSSIFSTWSRFSAYLVKKYFFNKQNVIFILAVALCGAGLTYLLRKMNDEVRNKRIVLVTTFIFFVVPFMDYLFTPSYNFNSDLVNIRQPDSAYVSVKIPRRIFWIILDEHPSSSVLNEVWNYRDTTFRSGLESLGFTIYDSCNSNYNHTAFSITATTYGAMLPISGPQTIQGRQWSLFKNKIFESPVMKFFRSQDYEIRNLSIFDSDFMLKCLTDQRKIFNSSVIGKLFSKFNEQNNAEEIIKLYNAERIDSLNVLLNNNSNDEKRIFVYAHLFMPHSSFSNLENDQAFLNNVARTDSTILYLLHKSLDSLSIDQKSNTIVMLQGDHGYRFLRKGSKDVRLRSSFGILNAVFWPKNLKATFYNGMSSVNTFRIMFRDLWGLRLDLVRDSLANIHRRVENMNDNDLGNPD